MKYITFYSRRWLLFILPCIILISPLFSCKKFVEIPLPQHLIQDETVFANDRTALSAVYGVYSSLSTPTLGLANGGMSVYSGYSSDELYTLQSATVYEQFYLNSLIPTNSAVNNLWNSYKSIYNINSTLEGLARSSALSGDLKKQLTGEMLFLRAFLYFYLENLFGEVPLILETDYRSTSNIGHTPSDSTYRRIIMDLKESIELLPTSFVLANRTRVNKFAAIALLARVYLYQKDWQRAETLCSTILSSGTFRLETGLNSVFTINSRETIWQLSRDNNNTSEGAFFVPASATVIPAAILTDTLLRCFNALDGRRQSWIGKNTVSSKDYYFPNKYKARLSTPITEYNIVLRIPEILLIRAEARTMQDALDFARSDLDSVRLRAGLSPIPQVSKGAMLDSIARERQREYFAEWGHRWLDLKRTHKADVVLSASKGSTWQATDTLYPIPQSELNLNPKLHQNAGY